MLLRTGSIAAAPLRRHRPVRRRRARRRTTSSTSATTSATTPARSPRTAARWRRRSTCDADRLVFMPPGARPRRARRRRARSCRAAAAGRRRPGHPDARASAWSCWSPTASRCCSPPGDCRRRRRGARRPARRRAGRRRGHRRRRCRALGARPDRTSRRVVGPAVCGGCYEVPQELADEVVAAVAGDPGDEQRGHAGARPARRRRRPAASRPASRTIEADPWCTAESPDLYSYRRDGVTGRFAGVVLP